METGKAAVTDSRFLQDQIEWGASGGADKVRRARSCKGMQQSRVRISDTICVIWMPVMPMAAERTHTSGIKKMP